MKLHVFDAIVEGNHLRGFTKNRAGTNLRSQIRVDILGITVPAQHWNYYGEVRTTDYPEHDYGTIIQSIKNRGFGICVVPMKFYVYDWHLEVCDVRIYSADKDLGEFRKLRDQLKANVRSDLFNGVSETFVCEVEIRSKATAQGMGIDDYDGMLYRGFHLVFMRAISGKEFLERSTLRQLREEFSKYGVIISEFKITDIQLSKNKSGSDDGVGLSEVRDFIVVAAVQELDAVRRCLDDLGLAREERFVDNRIAEVFRLTNTRRGEIAVGLMLPLQKGKSETKSLLETIKNHSSAKHVIMVGMMAGIKGKSKLLDVVCPLTIYDVTSVGTMDGKFIVEPEAGTVDPKLHNLVASIDRVKFQDPAIHLTSHKKTATFSAKIDDLTHDLASAALNIDRENVVGLEMEGSALIEMQSRNFGSRYICHLMIKGVADYAGERPGEAEIRTLAHIPAIKDHLSDPDPTKSTDLKAALQREATRRAFLVALDLLKRLPATSS